jgi:adenylate cyclase
MESSDRGEISCRTAGIPSRSKFAVFGAAANDPTRIEGLSKMLGRSLLKSQAFANRCSTDLAALGLRPLRDISDAQDV